MHREKHVTTSFDPVNKFLQIKLNQRVYIKTFSKDPRLTECLVEQIGSISMSSIWIDQAVF